MQSQVNNLVSTLFELHGANSNLAVTRVIPGLLRKWRSNKDRPLRVRLVGRRLPSQWVADILRHRRGAHRPSPVMPCFDSERRALVEFLRIVLHGEPKADVSAFAALCEHVQVDVRTKEDFSRLADADKRLNLDAHWKKVMYIALTSDEYAAVLKGIAAAGLANPCLTVVFEKPFARNIAAAKGLIELAENVLVQHGAFYRVVDHYLAKAGVHKNALFRRSTDGLIAGSWKSDRIKWVELSIFESLGAEGREHFFRTGIVGDVACNHGLEVLALMGMEPPEAWTADSIAAKRLEFLRSLSPVRLDSVVLGQYTAAAGMQGYLEEVDAWMGNPDNAGKEPLPYDKPTYFAGAFTSSLPRWQGRKPTVFVLRNVRRAPRKCMRMVVTSRRPENACVTDSEGRPIDRSQIVAQLDPAPFNWTSYFQVRVPGPVVKFRTETSVTPEDPEAVRNEFHEDAYDTLIGGALDDDWSWFPSSAEVLTCLEVFEPLLNGPVACPIHEYPSNTLGPEEPARSLFEGWSLHPL